MAPTAVVMHDTGPYAQQFYNAMSHAHSFRLQIASASDAQNLISTGKIVAVVDHSRGFRRAYPPEPAGAGRGADQ